MKKLFAATLVLTLAAGFMALGADQFVIGCTIGSSVTFYILGLWEL